MEAGREVDFLSLKSNPNYRMKVFALLSFVSLFSLANGQTISSPEYRAWLYTNDCKELNGKDKDKANAEYFMGNDFFSTDVYVEMEKMGFKSIKQVLRAQSMSNVDKATKYLTWVKANQSKFTDKAKLISAANKAVSDQSLVRYLQTKGTIDIYKLCDCFHQNRSKRIPDEKTFKASPIVVVESIDLMAKATCLKSLYKTKGWFF